jgi:peptidoglycan-associated lipoprotein
MESRFSSCIKKTFSPKFLMKYLNKTPIKYLASLFAITLLLSACSNSQNSPIPKAGSNTHAGGSGQHHGGKGGGSGSKGQGNNKGYYDGQFGKGGSGSVGGKNTALLKQRIIYFTYDSAQISAEGMDILAAHAHYLSAHPNKQVRLEGHADERGSREYNVALSLDRAIAAERFLNLKGANANIRTIPYGEEMPAVLGHDDSAWNKNRRVEIVY